MTEPADDKAKLEKPGQRLVPFHLKVDPRRIVDIKCTIESYEGIGIVRTLDPETGVIVILALEDTASAIAGVIDSFRQQFEMLELPLPSSYDDDWLLAEHFGSND